MEIYPTNDDHRKNDDWIFGVACFQRNQFYQHLSSRHALWPQAYSAKRCWRSFVAKMFWFRPMAAQRNMAHSWGGSTQGKKCMMDKCICIYIYIIYTYKYMCVCALWYIYIYYVCIYVSTTTTWEFKAPKNRIQTQGTLTDMFSHQQKMKISPPESWPTFGGSLKLDHQTVSRRFVGRITDQP